MDAFNTIMAIVVIAEQLILLYFILRESYKKKPDWRDWKNNDDDS